MSKQFEHVIIDRKDEMLTEIRVDKRRDKITGLMGVLDELGRTGWELVAVENWVFFMKKEISDE